MLPRRDQDRVTAGNAGCYGLLFVVSGALVLLGTTILAGFNLLFGRHMQGPLLPLRPGSLSYALLWQAFLFAGGLALIILGSHMRRDR